MINETVLHIHILFEDTVPEYWLVFLVGMYHYNTNPQLHSTVKYMQAKKSCVISSYFPVSDKICAKTKIQIVRGGCVL